jgi:hypothetical protein
MSVMEPLIKSKRFVAAAFILVLSKKSVVEIRKT